MIAEIKVPSPGESVTEVVLANWLVSEGDYVEKNQELAEIESDKATLPLISSESGKIELKIKEGETVPVGSVACAIDTDAPAGKKEKEKVTAPVEKRETPVTEAVKDKVKGKAESEDKKEKVNEPDKKIKTTPLARTLMEENGLSVEDIIQGLRKITTKEVQKVVEHQKPVNRESKSKITREVDTRKMSQLRKKLSQRLVAAKNETAMLTTFNEVDMSAVLSLRKKYQDTFREKHGIKLGIMSLFVKASAVALKQFPVIHSMIDGEDIITPSYVDICIAVQTAKGLMVPVIRNVETLTVPEIEHKISELAEKARSFKISVEEMTGGTFTITNGGVFGSMLSTPILNPPQSAILGMHNIVERPVAIGGKVEIRPIMYVALSYDHRIIDGADSVSFLVKIKELLENPSRMILSSDPDQLLLDL